AIPIILSPLMATSAMARLPAELSCAPRVDESHFELDLQDSEADAGWTRAVRQQTPSDTVLIVPARAGHVLSFAHRTLFVADDTRTITTGHGWDTRDNLVHLRGYSEQEYQRRIDLLRRVYSERDPRLLAADLQTLRGLRRPLAFHFDRRS